MDEINKNADIQYMALACELAQKGLGDVHPNPPVGCVIVDTKGLVLATGYHRKFGQAHAEVDALNQIKDHKQLEGATVYVTLEPCAHEGKTPSCAKALAQLPIAKVIFAEGDPNPLVNGQGLKILENAGIKTEKFQCEDANLVRDLHRLTEAFRKNISEQKSYISLKLATSLDGKIALSAGESSWITNEKSRSYVQYLRSQHDSILVGGRTLLNDNPKLNIRLNSEQERSNKLIVYDPKGSALKKMTGNEQIFSCRPKEQIFWLVDEPVIKADVQVQQLQMNWHSLLEDLYKTGLTSIFIEGGAFVASQFLKHNLVDRLHLFMAPFIIGKSPYAWAEGFSLEKMQDRINFEDLQIRQFDNDAYLSMRYGSTSRLNSKR